VSCELHITRSSAGRYAYAASADGGVALERGAECAADGGERAGEPGQAEVVGERGGVVDGLGEQRRLDEQAAPPRLTRNTSA